MKTGEASGAQIAFFTFAVLLLVVPVTGYVRHLHAWDEPQWRLINRGMPLLLAAGVLFAWPRLRRQCVAALSSPIPRERRTEVLLVSLAKLAEAFAWAGLWILWGWYALGPQGAEFRLQSLEPPDVRMAREVAMGGWTFNLLLGGLLAPIVEELTFRHFLYRAWERQWGWIPALLLSSALFGAYHSNFLPAFVGGIVFTCLLRRTGTLRAPIAAHAFFNIATSYPLLGQFVFQGHNRSSADPSAWGLQLACLLFVAIALPVYVWMSRDANAVPRAKNEEARAALPA